MSKLTANNVTITLNGEKVVLKPTPRAALAISTNFEGLQGAVPRLASQDIAAASFVVAAGAGIRGEAAKGLNEKIFAAGISDLAPSLIEFVVILMNGGKRPDSMLANDDSDAEDDEGNGED
ncbi:hypothetical protein [Azospirillum picis]|uniref:Uncharacterized protein n=1 Tax=Azospirillum picis TaxID=488438 RepID=A0ABU0MV03_9PROT|nr:hypothetical protein [Azospirillum picis]MBP2303421.1 hypothetical protein [Azospirillum picis]MDQ0537320.1 hypothetical protein [Azospirillum picis]